MTALLDELPIETGTTSAGRLRATTAALRLSFTWFGVRKTLSAEQKAQAAESFGAEGDFLSAGKKLIDTRHPRFKAVTAIRNQAVSYFKGISPIADRRHGFESRMARVDQLLARREEIPLGAERLSGLRPLFGRKRLPRTKPGERQS